MNHLQICPLIFSLFYLIFSGKTIAEEDNISIMQDDRSPPSVEDVERANALKEEGNECVKASKFNDAIEKYNQAIKLNRDPVYFCNRAAAYCRLEQYDLAIQDCFASLELDGNYAKAYGRMGIALTCQGRYTEAIEAYKKALELDPENENFKTNLTIAEEKYRETGSTRGGNPTGGLGGVGAGGMPDLNSLMNNPQMMQAAMQMMNDPNMQNLMESMMEQFMGGSAGGAGGGSFNDLLAAGQSMAQQMQQTNPEVIEHLRQRFSAASTEEGNDHQQNQDKNPANPEAEEDNVPVMEEDFLNQISSDTPLSPTNVEDVERANALKEEGNECVKALKFNDAIEKYNQAIKLNRDPVYFCNRAAAYCRLEQYDLAIQDCFASLELDGNYAKAYSRMGTALTCQGRYTEAIEAYNRALALDPENESIRSNLAIAEEKNRETGNTHGNPIGGLGNLLGEAGAGGMPDLGSLMNNPQMMQTAMQMMNDPNMQNLMGSMMEQFMGGSAGGAGGGSFNDLLAAGQSMAQQMQQANPELVEQLRRQYSGRSTEEGNDHQQNQDNSASDDDEKP